MHCLRDLTRGGLASATVEIAETARLAIALAEAAIPVRDDVAATCELLGFDPMHVANEGSFIAFVAADDATGAIDVLRRCPMTTSAALIGEVRATPSGSVSCRGPLGIVRVVDMLSGEQLPRICLPSGPGKANFSTLLSFHGAPLAILRGQERQSYQPLRAPWQRHCHRPID